MVNPDIKVVTDVLRSEARMWDEQSDALGKLHHAVEGLRVSRLEAGIYQVVFSAYETAVNEISDRCKEGRECTQEIADALIKSATAYDNQEEETTAHVEGTY
ncbi:type VII secretion target [Streptomyces tubercidicus]|uniref:type VII secretion target n=1 Tax=Streptomyces tubercidicus TaxID=47759 RepID=UPI0036CE6AC6